MRRLSRLEVLAGLEPTEVDATRTASRRDLAEYLHARQDLLGQQDKALLALYLETAASLDTLARLAGTSRSTMCRRIHRLIQRLCDPIYARCAQDRRTFSAAELAVLRDHLLRGRPLTRICRDHCLGYYRARAIVEKARRFARQPQKMGAAS